MGRAARASACSITAMALQRCGTLPSALASSTSRSASPAKARRYTSPARRLTSTLGSSSPTQRRPPPHEGVPQLRGLFTRWVHMLPPRTSRPMVGGRLYAVSNALIATSCKSAWQSGGGRAAPSASAACKGRQGAQDLGDCLACHRRDNRRAAQRLRRALDQGGLPTLPDTVGGAAVASSWGRDEEGGDQIAEEAL